MNLQILLTLVYLVTLTSCAQAESVPTLIVDFAGIPVGDSDYFSLSLDEGNDFPLKVGSTFSILLENNSRETITFYKSDFSRILLVDQDGSGGRVIPDLVDRTMSRDIVLTPQGGIASSAVFSIYPDLENEGVTRYLLVVITGFIDDEVPVTTSLVIELAP